MDRERGRLPAMQVFVEAQTTVNRTSTEIAVLRNERRALKRQRNEIQANYKAEEGYDALSKQLHPILRQLAEKKQKINELETQFYNARSVLTGTGKVEAKHFIMKCPGSDDCRGFLSTAWKCGTCEKFFCSDCHAQKSGMRDENHVCNEDAKATASMIRQETKPCPKCGIRIMKIDGCDQMWCTECHTTFSWNTGNILLNTVVHNPHYYEYLRKTNGSIPREAGDVPCGGLPYAYQFHQFVNQSAGLTYEQRNKLYMMHQGLNDIFARLPNYALRAPANMNRDIDIDYLMKKIDEDEWGAKLEHMETTFERKKEIGLILQTLVHIGAEKITSLMNQHLTNAKNRHAACMQTLSELHEVREFINTSLMKKGIQMCFVVPQINEDFQFKWATKEQMKSEKGKPTKNTTASTVSNEIVEPVRPASPIPSVLPPSLDPSLPALAQEQAEDKVFVEIEGEMVEMTYEQARLIMFMDELKNVA